MTVSVMVLAGARLASSKVVRQRGGVYRKLARAVEIVSIAIGTYASGARPMCARA